MELQTRTSGTSTATLGLGSVLVGSLPASLMTDHSPRRYTVEAVFTRRPEPDEVTGILGTRTGEVLTAAGYPEVDLAVSDRRLVIKNTSLEQLRDGLAGLLADRLMEISAGVQAVRDAAAVRWNAAAVTEESRVAAVTTLAESVAFHTSDPAHAGEADRAQLENWADEGGHGR